MNSILISLPPEKVGRLLGRLSKIIFVKSKPRCNCPIDVYVYCTKDESEELYYDESLGVYLKDKHDELGYEKCKGLTPLNGKVVAKFMLTNVEKVYEDENGVGVFTDMLDDCMLYELSGLNHDDLDDNDFDALSYEKLYAWYAAWVEVFDIPMELSEFKRRMTRKECIECAYMDMISSSSSSCRECPKSVFVPLKNAPRGWMYIETEGEQE